MQFRGISTTSTKIRRDTLAYPKKHCNFLDFRQVRTILATKSVPHSVLKFGIRFTFSCHLITDNLLVFVRASWKQSKCVAECLEPIHHPIDGFFSRTSERDCLTQEGKNKSGNGSIRSIFLLRWGPDRGSGDKYSFSVDIQWFFKSRPFSKYDSKITTALRMQGIETRSKIYSDANQQNLRRLDDIINRLTRKFINCFWWSSIAPVDHTRRAFVMNHIPPIFFECLRANID
jgi:hypothetical protein